MYVFRSHSHSFSNSPSTFPLLSTAFVSFRFMHIMYLTFLDRRMTMLVLVPTFLFLHGWHPCKRFRSGLY
ncbi:hypothetical protein M407DRAFT_88503 [Tulasnella calospora MUT 4182]|uniref:Uncharacterized protein n=1 Tax=Tulasnella calospora MUT 4182 TaxID=1051891 RepID=A0A0C3LKF5_9AGAM|nr:hypothetical protein M407DRAFT_88503 [Tulasnella calospora MUT 4182]